MAKWPVLLVGAVAVVVLASTMGESVWVRAVVASVMLVGVADLQRRSHHRVIAERVKAEERLRRVINQAGCIVFDCKVDTEGDLTHHKLHVWNTVVIDEEAAQRIIPLELQPGERYVDAWRRCRWKVDMVQSGPLFCEAIEKGHSGYQQAFRVTDRTGEVRWVSEDARIGHLGGTQYRVVVVASDITYQKQSEEALLAARQAADQANQAKSQFLANMSHEIRTPLTAIIGYAGLLSDSSLTHEEKELYAQTIQRNGEHLLGVINDVLDLSRIESGKMQLELKVCSPAQIARDVLELMRPAAKQKGLEMSLTLEGRIPERILSDAVRLGQILVNLVANAVKYTESGSVAVVLRSRSGTGQDVALEAEVTDTGIGIPEDQLGRLFRPFEQGDTRRTRRYEGAGLGLAISRRLAQLLGGDVWVESHVGVGSRFTARIVAQEAIVENSATSGRQQPVDLHGVRILLAEDSDDNRRLVSIYLRRQGAVVRVAEDGRKAVELALAWAGEAVGAMDVILMDMHMPRLDGYEATRQLRQAGMQTPVIALTAYAMEGDRDRCLAAGCDHYITKPIDVALLASTIRKCVAHRRGEPDALEMPVKEGPGEMGREAAC